MAGMLPEVKKNVKETERVHEVVTAAIAACHGVEELTEQNENEPRYLAGRLDSPIKECRCK